MRAVVGRLIVSTDEVVLRSDLPVAGGGIHQSLPGGAWLLLDLVEPDRIVELGWERDDDEVEEVTPPSDAALLELVVGREAWDRLLVLARGLAEDLDPGWGGEETAFGPMPSVSDRAGALLRCAVVDGVDRWTALPLDEVALVQERHEARRAAGLPTTSDRPVPVERAPVVLPRHLLLRAARSGHAAGHHRSTAERRARGGTGGRVIDFPQGFVVPTFVDPARVHPRVVRDHDLRTEIATAEVRGTTLTVRATASVALDPSRAEAQFLVAEVVDLASEVVEVVALTLDDDGSTFVGTTTLDADPTGIEVELVDARSLTLPRGRHDRSRALAQDCVLRAWRLRRLQRVVDDSDHTMVIRQVSSLLHQAREHLSAGPDRVLEADAEALERAAEVLGRRQLDDRPHLAPLRAESWWSSGA